MFNVIEEWGIRLLLQLQKSPIPKEKLVLIDFYADWCGPCRTMGPVVDQIAKDYDGKVKVGKINVDEEHEIAAQFGIRSIPCFVFMKDGEVADHVVGAVPGTELTYRIDELTKAA